MAEKFSIKQLLKAVHKLATEDAEPPVQNPRHASQQIEIENALLILCAEVLRSRQQYSTASEKFITDFFEKQFGEKDAQLRLQSVYNHIQSGTSPLLRIACTELSLLTTGASRIHITEFLFGLAGSDNMLSPRELRCLQRIANYLHIQKDDYRTIKERFVQLYDPYALLGCNENDSPEVIRLAYRKMVLKYHPDKQKNEAEKQAASQKFRQVKQAYESIKAKQGDKR